MKCTLAIVQCDAAPGDLRGNVERHADHAEQARKAGADLVVFPELSLTGYSLKDLAADLALDPATDPRLETLRKLSTSVAIVAGCVVSGDDHGVYNAAVHFEAGGVAHVHRKVYPPTYGMFEEGRYFLAGRQTMAYDSRLGRFGMLVCEDMWHVSLPYLLALDGAEAIFCLTASPTRVSSATNGFPIRTVNHEHQRSYARLLSVYTVFCNRVGYEDGVNFWGGSAAFGPSGDLLAEAPLFDEQMSIVRLDSQAVRRARRASRHLLDERPELLQQSLRQVLQRRS